MRLATFQEPGGKPQAGVVRGGEVVGLAAAGFAEIRAVLEADNARARIEAFLSDPPADSVHSLADVRLLAPLPRPGKLVCIGLNYRDHAEETRTPLPPVPTVFAKLPTAVIGPGDPIVLPRGSSRVDYEGEMAFVIGRGGRYIPRDAWREHVFGYTILNDVTARDVQTATSQWTMGKSFDTFAPMGPYLVTADEIPDLPALDIRLTLNGEVMQSSNTRNLIFGVPELVEYLSSVFTLEPGDVVSTGTPGGVGSARKPPVYLRAGDCVEVRVEGLGELRNPVVSE
jgi:2-keto-4-pentenoate hydratase/2-oxohepta-3-ene-1,7-dioic acid hydratase in catechol pathway